MDDQLKTWDGSKNVFLWIIKTDCGQKRTWKATPEGAVKASKARGFKVLSIRAGTVSDAWIK